MLLRMQTIGAPMVAQQQPLLFVVLWLWCASSSGVHAQPSYQLVKTKHECNSRDKYLGKFGSVQACATACQKASGCRFFVLGQRYGAQGNKEGQCYYEYTNSAACVEGWESDSYNFYQLACDASSTLAHGSVGDCTSSLAYGSSCQPTCNAGYTVSGTSSCTTTGTLKAATCSPNPCDASVAPTNGGVGDCTSSLASGASCTPTCNAGYKVSGLSSCMTGTLKAATCSVTAVIPGKIPLPSQVNRTRACPLAKLETRLVEVNKVCCFARTALGTKCVNQSALSCSVDCAMSLVPLMHDCRPILDLLYDPLDKVRDGHAAILDAAWTACKAIPSQAVLDELVQLHKKNPKVCTDKVLDNVAKTKVLPSPCVDVNPNCAAGIKVNFISCATAAGMCDKTCKVCSSGKGAASVCQDTNPKCAAAVEVGFINCATQNGICDKTCKKCKGGHRRVQQNASVHRRTQGFQMLTPCKLATFAADMSKLNKACCDEPGICKTGVPKSCDAKCAITFVEFYNRCHRVLALRVAKKQLREFKQLHDTCSHRLPAWALLRAVKTCRSHL
jgi:hypothetical protein